MFKVSDTEFSTISISTIRFSNNTKIALTELIGGIRKQFGKLQGEPETKETIKKAEEISLLFFFKEETQNFIQFSFRIWNKDRSARNPEDEAGKSFYISNFHHHHLSVMVRHSAY